MHEQRVDSSFQPENAESILLLVDRDLDWLDRLERCLKRQLPETVRIKIILDLEGSPETIRLQAGKRPCLMLAAASLGQRCEIEAQGSDPFSWAAWETPIASEGNKPLRHLPASRMAAWIAGQLQESKERTQIPLPLSAPPVQDLEGLILAIDHGWPGHHRWLSRRMDEARQRGLEVVYLGLKPSHQLTLIRSPGSGPNLTAALLRIEQGESLSPETIGHYLEPHPAGYWQFRPPERSDDILLASLPAVRTLVSLVRQRFLALRPPGESVLDSTLLVVDVSGFTWQAIGVLAVLSDHLAIRMDLADTFAAQSSQRELSVLLAKLPASCTIIEMRHDDDSRLCDSATSTQPSDPASGCRVRAG